MCSGSPYIDYLCNNSDRASLALRELLFLLEVILKALRLPTRVVVERSTER